MRFNQEKLAVLLRSILGHSVAQFQYVGQLALNTKEERLLFCCSFHLQAQGDEKSC